jgi:hypothetical protein
MAFLFQRFPEVIGEFTNSFRFGTRSAVGELLHNIPAENRQPESPTQGNLAFTPAPSAMGKIAGKDAEDCVLLQSLIVSTRSL